MWSLFPRKFRLFFSKLVGKLSRKCKNSSPAGIRRKDRNRPRIKAFDPEDDLRRTALKNSFVNKINHGFLRYLRYLQVQRLEYGAQEYLTKIRFSRWKRWRYNLANKIKVWWVDILNLSYQMNCFNRFTA